MVLFWVCVPLMVLAIGWAVGSILIPSLRERRKVHAEELITGAAIHPYDGAVRLAVDVDPLAAGGALDVLKGRLDRHPRLDPADAIVERTTDDRQLLVTVPKETISNKQDTVDELRRQIEVDEAFGEVRELRSHEGPAGP
jgi:hypothetical protein